MARPSHPTTPNRHPLAVIARSLGELDLRHLAALGALADAGSLRGAAVRLGVAPATVARWIARLEAVLQSELVVCGHRGSALTDAGRLLAAHADAVAAELRAARDDLDALVAGEAGAIRIGTIAGRAGRLPAQIVAALTQRRPRLDALSVDLPDAERGAAQLAAGELDLLIAEEPLPPGGFDSCQLLLDRPTLLVPAGSVLAERAQALTPADLTAMRLVGPRSPAASARLIDALRRSGVRPLITQHADEAATVHALVRAGLASAVLPRLAVDPHDRGTIGVDLGHLLEPIAVVLAWRSGDRRPAVVAVREVARAACAELLAHRRLLWQVAS